MKCFAWRRKKNQLILVVFAAMMAISQPVAAIPSSKIDLFAENNIIHYDPDDDCVRIVDDSDCISSNGENLMVFGDDLSEAIKEKMFETLSGLRDERYHIQQGGKIADGIELVKEVNNLEEIVLFIFGSNDSESSISEDQLKELREIIGANKTLVLVTAFSSDKNLAGNNKIVKEFEGNKRTIVVDWGDMARRKRSSYFDANGSIPNEEGVNKLVDVIFAAINTPCLRDEFGNKVEAELINDIDRVDFFGTDTAKAGGVAGKNGATNYNGGNLSAGQIATMNANLQIGDVVYIEVDSEEASYADGKYFIVTDKSVSESRISIFHDPSSENSEIPYGVSNSVRIYKVKSQVSWDAYLEKYFWNNVSSFGSGVINNMAGQNKDYEGNPVFSDDELAVIEKNRNVYEQAAKKVGLPWQVIAALHYRENALEVYNPDNGQGIFQLYSYTNAGTNSNAFPEGAVSEEEFLRQAILAAEEFKENEPELTISSSGDIVKRAFFKYNGMAQVYISQARDLGFSEEEANNGEGSPYVMNRADADRDPTKNPRWGQIKHDNGGIEYPANLDYGAYIMFVALGGGTGNYISCNGGGGGNMDVTSTAWQLAWKPGEGGYGGLDPNDEYRRALAEVGLNVYDDAEVRRGSSCDAFVATVYRYSGVDPDFACCGVDNQRDYLINNPKYEKLPLTTDTSVLKTGDIMLIDGAHIKMYVEKDGIGYEAQGSYGEHSGQISNGVNLTDSLGRGTYEIFRYKG